MTNKLKTTLKNIFRFKFVIYLVILGAFYFVATNYVTNAELNDLEKWRIPDVSKLIEPVRLVIQASIAAVILISIFYVGKFHDYTRDFITKLGEFDEAIIKFNQSTKPKAKKLIEITKKTDYFEKKLGFQKGSSGITLSVTLVLLFLFAYQFFKIFNSDFDDLRENFLYMISLASSTAFFFFHWYHLDYMITNRQEFYRELVSDIAQLKSFIH